MARPNAPGETPRSRNYRRFWDGPKQIGAGVERVMKHLNAPTPEVIGLIFSDWDRLAGDVIGGHSRPQKIVDGVLYLEVDEPAWASELEWMSEDLLHRISDMAETVEITSIKVVLAR